MLERMPASDEATDFWQQPESQEYLRKLQSEAKEEQPPLPEEDSQFGFL